MDELLKRQLLLRFPRVCFPGYVDLNKNVIKMENYHYTQLYYLWGYRKILNSRRKVLINERF